MRGCSTTYSLGPRPRPTLVWIATSITPYWKWYTIYIASFFHGRNFHLIFKSTIQSSSVLKSGKKALALSDSFGCNGVCAPCDVFSVQKWLEKVHVLHKMVALLILGKAFSYCFYLVPLSSLIIIENSFFWGEIVDILNKICCTRVVNCI